MKKHFITPLIVLFFLGIPNTALFGQENRMIVKIVKNGEIIMDTVITLDEDQNPDDMKEMVRHLAGAAVKVRKDDKAHVYVMKHGDKDFKFVTKQAFKHDTSAFDHEVFVWTSEDGEKVVKKKIVKGDKMIFIRNKDDEEEEEKEYTIIIKSGDEDDFEFETEEIEVEVEKKKEKKD